VSAGAEHDVDSFALYPIEHGLDPLRQVLRECFPRDFKKTGEITRAQKHFFHNDLCFCFVFLVSRTSKFLRTGNRDADLMDARRLLAETVETIEANGKHSLYIARLRALVREANKKNFSLYLFERVLVLSMLNAYVAWKLAASMPMEKVAWFPDADEMTMYQDAIFNVLTHINFHSLWEGTFGRKQHPVLGYIDRRVRNAPLDGMIDELIRVPDFFSAVLSRWRLQANVLRPPDGAKRAAMQRYISVMKHWLTENDSLWLANCCLKGEDLQTGRIITAKTRRRLGKLRSLKGENPAR
jgi:hypothetical protein